MFSDDELDRYSRHILLKEIGGVGQARLKSAKIALIGAGGIGAPSALYLAAAGVGQITLIDDDVVSLSNLQRQIIYRTEDIDKPKVDAAAISLKALNPYTDVKPMAVRLDDENAADILKGHDIVLDGSDNFETRFLVNRSCHDLAIPLVSAALGRFDAQLASFDGRPCYQCLVPTMPPDAETCARVGVVGALCGIIGSMAALEVVKLITGAGDNLMGKLLIFDGLTMTSRIVTLKADPHCQTCAKGPDQRIVL